MFNVSLDLMCLTSDFFQSQFSEKLSFKSYGQGDMEEIMRSRLEDPSVVHPAALTFIAKKWSGSSGDVRKAIEHLTTALKDAKARAQDHATVGSQLLGGAPKQGQYLVSMRDVIKVNSDYTRLSGLIEGLPTYSKLAVSVAAKLVKANNEGAISRRDMLREFIAVYTDKFQEFIDEAQAGTYIDQLDDLGIAIITRHDFDEGRELIQFNYLSQELQEAAEVAMGKDRFFDV